MIFETFFRTKTFILLLFLINNVNIFSQKANNDISRGNEKYNVNQFVEAEIEYRKALSKDSASFVANYDLGNALYRQGKYGEALDSYVKSLNNSKNISKLQSQHVASAFHNAGNALLAAKQYAQSIEAYKNALRINPHDNETRYNLAYAQQFLSKEPQAQQPQNSKQPTDDNNRNQNQDAQPTPKMSKEEAQQLLNALMQDENQTKADAQKAVSKSRQQPEKDW
ncbi:MAG: tetratricopeptide repeat protein [Prevotellaceae bacterium]|nr:tetratricopeptide repeat protein [Prevotellaceae bacterium]